MTLGAAQVALAPQQLAQGEGGGRIERRQALRLFERGARVIASRPDHRKQGPGSRRFPCRWYLAHAAARVVASPPRNAAGQPPDAQLPSLLRSCPETSPAFLDRSRERSRFATVQFIVFAELNPVVDGSLVRLWNVVGRLRANVNLRLGSPIVFALSLPQQQSLPCRS